MRFFSLPLALGIVWSVRVRFRNLNRTDVNPDSGVADGWSAWSHFAAALNNSSPNFVRGTYSAVDDGTPVGVPFVTDLDARKPLYYPSTRYPSY
jgi:hypothetical protein